MTAITKLYRPVSLETVENLLFGVEQSGVTDIRILRADYILKQLADTMRENERMRSKLLEADTEASAGYLLNVIEEALDSCKQSLDEK